MNERPDVSIVVPTRDRVPFLMRALAAAQRQVGVSTELVVVDDGAGEGAVAAARLGWTQLRTLTTGGAGQVAARNLGVGAAQGTVIAFLDDDDWWEDDHHLARLARALGGRAGFAYASGEIVHETAGQERLGALPFHAHASAASIRRDNTLLVSGVAFHRDVARRVGPFDAGLPCYWDWDFYLRVFAAGAPVVDGGGTGVRISVRAGTVSAGDNAEVRRRDLDRLANKHGLGRLVLKNHEGIAAEQAADGRIEIPGTVALVTGASRREGLGFEVSRQLAAKGITVLLTARDAAVARANAAVLAAEGLDVRGHALDVASDASADALAGEIAGAYGRLDILVNNAAGVFDATAPTIGAAFADVRAALDINLFGPWRMIRVMQPLLLGSPHPRIVCVSSEAASFGAPNGMPWRGPNLGAYAVSKAAQNAMTVKVAAALEGTSVLINAVDPGWIATYPGTAEQGARPVKDGAAGVVWAATLPDGGPSGRFFRDATELPW